LTLVVAKLLRSSNTLRSAGRFALNLAVCLPLISFSACRAALSEDNQKTSAQVDSSSGSAAPTVVLAKTPCGGFEIVYALSPMLGFDTPILMSIEKKNLKDLSFSEVQSMLYKQSIELEFMTRDGGRHPFGYKQGNLGDFILKGGRPLNNFAFDNRDGNLWLEQYGVFNADIAERAAQNISLREAQSFPDDDPLPLSTAAMSAALSNYNLGNIADGDKYFALSTSSFKSGRGWRLCQRHFPTESVQALISFGRTKEAEQLLSMLREGKVLEPYGDSDAYKRLVYAQLKQDKNEALASVEKYRDDRKNSAFCRRHSERWLAQVYEIAGKTEKAKEVYSELIDRATPSSGDWVTVQEMAADYFRLAELQFADGDKTGAIVSLERAAAKIKGTVAPEQLAIIQNMPGVFPKLNDLDQTIAAVKYGKEFPSHSFSIEGAKSLEPLYIRDCHDAIAKGDEKLASNFIDKLMQSYTEPILADPYSSETNNTYCSIMTLAREISNAGWFNFADDVLQRLRVESVKKGTNKIANAYLEVELIYNAKRQKQDVDSLWKNFSEIYPAMHQPRVPREVDDDLFSERLRTLALTFYYAGELKRAEFLINRALEEHKRERNEALKEQPMLLLDAACIAAAQNQFKKANLYWAQISKLPADDRDGYGHTIVELCSVYALNGQKERTVAMLQAAKTKLAQSRSDRRDSGTTAVDVSLAKMLLDSGMVNDAHAIASAVLKRIPQNLYRAQFLTIARCAKAAGDNAEAVECYSRAAWTNDPTGFQTQGTHVYLQKGIDLCPDKSSQRANLENRLALSRSLARDDRFVNVRIKDETCDAFVREVEKKQFDSALKVLDQILSGDLTTGDSLSQARLRSGHSAGRAPHPANAVEILMVVFKELATVDLTEPAFVKDCLDRILKAQKKCLNKDDERLVPTLARLGDINFQLNNFEEADSYYREALEITCIYHRGRDALQQIGTTYLANLRKLGRYDEAERLSQAELTGMGL
jgi:tetratricopeptide (TPR) repeat protein